MINNRTYLLLILILILLVSISGISVPIVANAAKYAQISREILINNDWINLTIGGDAYDQKPPLLFWIGAAFYSIFGVSFPVFKIAVLLISILGIYSTFRLGELLYNKNTGLLAAIFWTSSLGFLYFHNDIHTDTLLATFVAFSVWQFIAYFKSKKWYQFVLGAVGIGLSMLTKGPVGLAIPVFAIGANLIMQKRWNEIFHLRWIVAAIIVSIIILPALIGLLNQFGLEGIKFYFWTNNMGRITGSYHGNNTDPTFYIHTALYMLAPWTVFVVVGIFNEIRSLFKIKKENILQTEIANIST
ncbi:MAG: glycosyltransferase family 39 protein, partial [Bacteroidetes bacterium]|nr:glycosyltransferase family 39 protein [Bacteroidota bacterium]